MTQSQHELFSSVFNDVGADYGTGIRYKVGKRRGLFTSSAQWPLFYTPLSEDNVNILRRKLRLSSKREAGDC